MGSSLEEGFEEFGFLSNNLDNGKHELVADNVEWFDLAKRINTLALRLWGTEDLNLRGKCILSREAINARLMSRSIGSFEAAIILAKYGMFVEPLNQSRSIYESAFWMGSLNKDYDSTYEMFLNEAYLSDLSREVFIEKNEWHELRDREIDIEFLRSKINKKFKPSMKNLAEFLEVPKLYLKYKLICDDASHASLRSTGKYLFVHDDEVFHNFGPDTVNVRKIFPILIEPMFYCLRYYAETCRSDHVLEEVNSLEVDFFEMVENFK